MTRKTSAKPKGSTIAQDSHQPKANKVQVAAAKAAVVREVQSNLSAR